MCVSAAESEGFHPEAFLIYEKGSHGLHLPAVAGEMETAMGSARGDFPVLVQGSCKVSPQCFPRPWGCPAGEFRLLRPKVPSCRFCRQGCLPASWDPPLGTWEQRPSEGAHQGVKSHWESILVRCHLRHARSSVGPAGQACPPVGDGPPTCGFLCATGWEGSRWERLPYLHLCRQCGRAGAATGAGGCCGATPVTGMAVLGGPARAAP